MSATCRDAVLEAMSRLAVRSNADRFDLREIVAEVLRHSEEFAESTIRSHVTSRMCANAPDNHAVKYHDLERVERGVYRLLPDHPERT